MQDIWKRVCLGFAGDLDGDLERCWSRLLMVLQGYFEWIWIGFGLGCGGDLAGMWRGVGLGFGGDLQGIINRKLLRIEGYS